MPCACGCGIEVDPLDAKGRPRRFVRGHHGRRPIEVRFHEKTIEGPAPEHRPDLGPCLLWTGAISDTGYGSIRAEDGTRNAHAVAWMLAGRPPAEELDHLCRVRRCVRFGHLEDVSHAENMARSARPTCRRGHPWTPGSTYVRKDTGGRFCLTCQAERRKERRARVSSA